MEMLGSPSLAALAEFWGPSRDLRKGRHPEEIQHGEQHGAKQVTHWVKG
jgi:hypothetical protein